MAKQFKHAFLWCFIASSLLYVVVYMAMVWHAYQFSNQSKFIPLHKPVMLVLGNRTTTKGVPNVCMTGRVDKAMQLLNEHGGDTLLASGGVDPVQESFESQVMASYAEEQGFSGRVIQERKSTTTYENLVYSTPLLLAMDAKTVVIISEPHHIWRASLLARAQGMSKMFDLHFVAAPTECWNMQGILSTGALKEPLALIKNYLQGNF
jgi:uncharacterized SAM-binding protein YcdF (DUF218 family)